MPGQFEMDPSPYHLGACNFVLRGGPTARLCGRPAVRRWLGLAAAEAGGDLRRCLEHTDSRVPRADEVPPEP